MKLAVRMDAIPGAGSSATALRKALTMAAAMGVRSVELCGRTHVPVSELSDTGVRTLRKILDDLNLRLTSIRFQTRMGYDVTENLDERVDATKKALKTAYRLGAPLIINQIGTVPPAPKSDAKDDRSRASSLLLDPSASGSGKFMEDIPADLAAELADSIANSRIGKSIAGGSAKGSDNARWHTLKEVMDDLGRYGAKVGCFLAAETGTESGQDLAALLDSLPDTFVPVALNPGQLIVNRFDVHEAIDALNSRISIVHAVDGVVDLAAGRGVNVPLGEGTADFPSLLGHLEDIPFRGPIVVGRNDMRADSAVQELRQGLEYLRNL
ncbi:sugar phosphate isomerase/epimerase [Rhodopirellula sp. JC740]|uniref:Sugar phosphate isomerase/epimerase n=1 Tax=Rhodopirellula halodulae TaxID=2894198 RepID=A0ABS8NN29_9BACT|nr:sugar phosphate isomerase/epimerase [Rhodopirellula sp. JC740]MCC9658918.1 sugar phosphate isomerase/epimerase [Rhodopirellula sp. JC737]